MESQRIFFGCLLGLNEVRLHNLRYAMMSSKGTDNQEPWLFSWEIGRWFILELTRSRKGVDCTSPPRFISLFRFAGKLMIAYLVKTFKVMFVETSKMSKVTRFSALQSDTNQNRLRRIPGEAHFTYVSVALSSQMIKIKVCDRFIKE